MPNVNNLYQIPLTKIIKNSRKILAFRPNMSYKIYWEDEIRKVKAVSPSPFYDGKYHPPLFKQLSLLFCMSTSYK